MQQQQVPYNTGKVKIGARFYDAVPMPVMDWDALELQRALLSGQDRSMVTEFINFIMGDSNV